MFEHFDHTADLGLRVRAATFEGLLSDAGRGLLAMHVANPKAVQPVQARTITLVANEPALLLFDWLSELLYCFESEKLLLAEFDIELRGREGDPPRSADWRTEPNSPRPMVGALRAKCRGELMDQSRHIMDHEVKAITYHGLVCEKRGDGWLAEVIVDI